MGSKSKDEAQETLDNRNGKFYILNYNGMRDKSVVICRNCGSILHKSIDSLLRADTSSHGCTYCQKKSMIRKLEDNGLEYLENESNGNIKARCRNCLSVISNKSYLLTRQNFICKGCDHLSKIHRVITHPEHFEDSTVNHALEEFNIKLNIDMGQTDWFYCLGLLLSDGHFDTNINRMSLYLDKKDKETICGISNIIGCKIKETKRCYGIDIVSPIIGEIITKYRIKSNKTYEPCDISSISGEDLTAFVIGFIDGDGNIGKRSDSKKLLIQIKLHSSWDNNLQYMTNHVYHSAGIYDRVPKVFYIKQNGKSYACVDWGNRNILLYLLNFLKENKLNYMPRKWGKLEVI